MPGVSLPPRVLFAIPVAVAAGSEGPVHPAPFNLNDQAGPVLDIWKARPWVRRWRAHLACTLPARQTLSALAGSVSPSKRTKPDTAWFQQIFLIAICAAGARGRVRSYL